MANRKDRKGLGRGLSALMADIDTGAPDTASAAASTPPAADRLIPVDLITPNAEQPRRHFSDTALQELAGSIAEKGIIQPLILRPDPEKRDAYQIVAGERRWRAAQIARLHEVPAIIRDFDDTEVLEVAIIENIQRADLNALEEAQGYRQLMERFGHTQDHVANAMGKSRSHIANQLRLLTLPQEVQDMVTDGHLTAGHARALVTAEDPTALARTILSRDLSVREAEKLARGGAASPKGRAKAGARPVKDADTVALESDLSAALGQPVSIEHDQQTGEGRVSIRYRDLQQLDDLVRLLGGG